jgi:hypothetical protein
MSIVSRWPVVRRIEVGPADLDADGYLLAPAAARIFAEVRRVYLDDCATLGALDVMVRECVVERGDARVDEPTVTAATNVSEIYPESFTMTLRVRPASGPGIVASGLCSLTTGGALPIACRDEFIARAHNARYTH